MRTITAGLLLTLSACQPSDINPQLAPPEQVASQPAAPTPEAEPSYKTYKFPHSYYSKVMGKLVAPSIWIGVFLLDFKLQYDAAYRSELIDVIKQHMASQGLIHGPDYTAAIEYDPSMQSSVLKIHGSASLRGRTTQPFYPVY